MTKAVFIITIDTEGDDLWSRPERIATENRKFIPRFQSLCESYGFKPVYLTNYEMANDPQFVALAKPWVERGDAEVGLHLHGWDTPPLDPRYGTRFEHVYQYELPDELLRKKTATVHNLLCDRFGIQPVSHRAGRWGFDGRVGKLLEELGYTVDCSVVPWESFRRHKGLPSGNGGPDFFGFPSTPYRLDLSDISRPGSSNLLEVPVTIKPNYTPGMLLIHNRHHNGVAGKAIRKLLGEPVEWLRPTGRNLDGMLGVIDWAAAEKLPVLEFMLHSSELMPGGSPRFTNEEAIERLYSHIKTLFDKIAAYRIRGVTLAEYRKTWEAIA